MAEIKVTRSSDKKVNDTKKKVEKKTEDGFKELNKSLTEQAKSLDAQTKLLTEQAKSMKALLSAIKDLKKKKAPETSTKSKASFERDMNKIKVDIENTRLAKANIMVEHSSIMLQKAALGLEAYTEKVAYDRKLRQEAEEERYRDSYKKSMPFRAARAVSEEKGGFAKSTLISMMTGGLLNPAVVNALGIDKLLFSPITALTRKMFRSKGDEKDNSSGSSEGNSGSGLLGKFFGKKSLDSDERTSSAVAQSKNDPVLQRLDTIINLLKDGGGDEEYEEEEEGESLLSKAWGLIQTIFGFAKKGMQTVLSGLQKAGTFLAGWAMAQLPKLLGLVKGLFTKALPIIGAAVSAFAIGTNVGHLVEKYGSKAGTGIAYGVHRLGIGIKDLFGGYDSEEEHQKAVENAKKRKDYFMKQADETAMSKFAPYSTTVDDYLIEPMFGTSDKESNKPVSTRKAVQNNNNQSFSSYTATPPKNIDPEYIKAVQKVSNEYGIDPAFMLSQIKAESNFNKNAVSYDRNGRRLAYGSTQFIDSTWNQYGKGLDRSSIEGQVTAQGRYLNDLLKQFDGDYRKAAAAYNAGPERVKTWERRAERNGTDWEDELQASAWGGDRVHGFQQTVNYLDNIERNKYAMNSLLRDQGIENNHRIETIDLPSSDTIYAAKNMQSNTDLANRIEENIINNNNNINSTPVIYQNNITAPAPKSVYACGDVAKTLIMGA